MLHKNAYSSSTSSGAGESEGLNASSAVVETAPGLTTSLGKTEVLPAESREQSLSAANLTSEEGQGA